MNRALPFLLLVFVAFGAACEEDKQTDVYRPGGAYQSKLDARGRKVMVQDSKGNALGKLRLRDQEIVVYGADMVKLGSAAWRTEGEKTTVLVKPRDSEEAAFVEAEPAVWKLEGRLRIERVERGWALYGANGQRLGYVERMELGKFALRDDYSSPPRVLARVDEGFVKSPAGSTFVQSTPRTEGVMLLPFALEGLDNLTRIGLGLWLRHAMPDAETPPAEEAATDLGRDATD